MRFQDEASLLLTEKDGRGEGKGDWSDLRFLPKGFRDLLLAGLNLLHPVHGLVVQVVEAIE